MHLHLATWDNYEDVMYLHRPILPAKLSVHICAWTQPDHPCKLLFDFGLCTVLGYDSVIGLPSDLRFMCFRWGWMLGCWSVLSQSCAFTISVLAHIIITVSITLHVHIRLGRRYSTNLVEESIPCKYIVIMNVWIYRCVCVCVCCYAGNPKPRETDLWFQLLLFCSF